MKNVVAIILAAGRGTRMKSGTPKVLHNVLGRPLILHILEALKAAGIKEIITVAGYGSELLKKNIDGTKIVVQKKLLGSGDAVMTARSALKKHSGDVLIICGDTPLIKPRTIKELVKKHKSSGASLTILTAKVKDLGGYGRIIRKDGGRVSKIVEDQDLDAGEKYIDEINVGTYCFKTKDLFAALSEIKPDNKKKEFFLTDSVGILNSKGKTVEAMVAENANETIGINSRKELAEAACILKNEILEDLMSNGVTIEDPATTVIHPDVKIGTDTIIYPNTVIESGVMIGKSCKIGPFARLRPGSVIDDGAEVGNFVELVRTRVGSKTKVKHHTYLGDTSVGKKVNIGAGTITANYDGKKKNKTIIGDGAFIGVGAILIAPVKIGKKAIVGAGCVVPKNHNVPDGATVVGVPARIFKRK